MSNPTKRVIAVLNYLAQQPERSLSLSELARELDISKSTLHPLTETLVDAGYLLRDNDKRLHLGPALTGLGTAALGHRGHLVNSLRGPMEEIAQHLDTHCILTAEFGEWVVPLAATGEPSRVTTLFQVGTRTQPFAPPLGMLFLLGRSMTQLQEWFGRAHPAPDQREIDMVMTALEQLRTHGVAAAARLDAKARAEQVIFGHPNSERDDDGSVFAHMTTELRQAQYLVMDFTDLTPSEIEWVGIPLMNKSGLVDIALSVVNFPKPLTGPDILDIGHYLRSVASSVRGVRLSPVPQARPR